MPICWEKLEPIRLLKHPADVGADLGGASGSQVSLKCVKLLPTISLSPDTDR